MTEGEIQRQCFQHLRQRAMPGVVAWHVPNDPRSKRKAGYLAGVSDINAVHRGKFYALELKKDGGRPTVEQMKFVSDITNAGGYAVVAEGLDEALAIMEAWGILRKAA